MMNKIEIIKLTEPSLLFGFNQAIDDPRDGLTLFGPLDEGNPYGVRYGVIGSRKGINFFKLWVSSIQKPLFAPESKSIARPFFPGFESIFGIEFSLKPHIEVEITEEELNTNLSIKDNHKRIFNVVESYSSRIISTKVEDDITIDLWFVIIPDNVYALCRPLSKVYKGIDLLDGSQIGMSKEYAASLSDGQIPIFEEDLEEAEPYQYDLHFHNQLKAKLLEKEIPTQIIRESTIAHKEVLNQAGKPLRKLDGQESAIAWNLSTATFYKIGGRPWKINAIRKGVCYIGIVFKKHERDKDPNAACCAAQMFLDSGDGIVFKGAIGPWRTEREGEFHLRQKAAKELVEKAIKAYKNDHGTFPKELFLHGKVRFNNEEWIGFKEAVPSETNLVGVQIKNAFDLKLYKKTKYPTLRGLAYIRDDNSAYLWTRGFVPRLQDYIGREVPNPLYINICKGEASIEIVLNDIMALTKLNYNSCIFADGLPVTLRFADAVGEILTAGPKGDINPLPFKYYI